MTGSRKIITEMRLNVDNVTVSYGDMSQSEVLGLGKVVVAPDISLVDVMLVETLGYNLLLICELGKKGFAVFIDYDIVVLLWIKSLKVAFVGHIGNNFYVVDFSGKTTTSAMCLFGKADAGWIWHCRLAPCQHENFEKSSQGRPHSRTKRKCLFCQRSCLQGLY
jgi:hypothetical protein